MSIMTDARLRLLEARVTKLERRLGSPATEPAETVPETSPSTAGAAKPPKKTAHKPGKRSRKTP